MPDTKISALPAATALTGAELMEVVQDATNKQITVSAIGGGLFMIYNYRNQKKTLTGAQTLNSATATPGDTLIFTGAAATWTVPARLATATDTGITTTLLIHNRGTGAITLSASGVTLIGPTSIAINGSGSIEWESNGTTQYAWVRTS